MAGRWWYLAFSFRHDFPPCGNEEQADVLSLSFSTIILSHIITIANLLFDYSTSWSLGGPVGYIIYFGIVVRKWNLIVFYSIHHTEKKAIAYGMNGYFYPSENLTHPR